MSSRFFYLSVQCLFFSFVVTFYTLDTVLLSKPTITRTIQAIELLFEGKPVNAIGHQLELRRRSHIDPRPYALFINAL